jgi:hypothetical protein
MQSINSILFSFFEALEEAENLQTLCQYFFAVLARED